MTPGSRLGPYEVVAKIGEGGMGEVYRARDTKLNRDVAIKVLPEAFALDAERLARSTREAQVLAALNHPNIAHIHGLEESGGVRALVMELVEGEDLSAHIARGPIPLAEALPIARQIAEALEAAHEQGIIHRDLKPANIKVRADGTVKVLDFGLAKAIAGADGAGSGDVTANAPTITTPAMTQKGMILGTAAYMSPEQARGKPVDRRADIWAFGAVLYEMLTGRRAFAGDDVSITLANVLKEDVKWDALPDDVPLSIRRLLRRCLEKDPRRRLSAIGDARLELDERGEVPDARPVPATTGAANHIRERSIWAALVIAAAALTLLATKWFAGAAPEPMVSRFELALPAKTLALGWPELSPDGRQIATVAGGDDAITRIWVRPLDAVAFRMLAGTEGASYPVWSPDGRSIGFFAGDKLKKIAMAGGPPQTLCLAPRARGGTWSPEGTILFSANQTTGPNDQLQQVADSGGTPADVAPLALSKVQLQRWPHFLPDGRHFLFTASARDPASDGVYVASIDEPGATRLVDGITEARYRDGTLFFRRADTLMAQPFDAARRVLGPGEAMPVVSAISNGANEGAVGFSVSATTLVSVSQVLADVRFQLRWFDRSGRALTDLGVPARQLSARISPDGLRVVTSSADAVWITDLKSGGPKRLTFAEGGYRVPVWSPDGKSVVFAKQTQGIGDLFRQPVSGGASQELLVADGVPHTPYDVSPDGRNVIYLAVPTQSTSDLWVLSLADRKSALYVRGANYARVSPDGRWAAYTTRGPGSSEIFLEDFPTPGANKIQVTTGGGTYPVWRRDGRELFYQSGGKLMAVPVSTSGGAPVLGEAVTLFALPPQPLVFGLFGFFSAPYDVAPDGRFLFSVPVDPQSPTAILTLNWKSGLKQ